MTQPKRRVGNPLGDSKQPIEERKLWQEAHHFAKILEETAHKIVLYTEGQSSSPLVHDLKVQADRLHDALLSVIHMRQGRLRG